MKKLLKFIRKLIKIILIVVIWGLVLILSIIIFFNNRPFLFYDNYKISLNTSKQIKEWSLIHYNIKSFKNIELTASDFKEWYLYVTAILNLKLTPEDYEEGNNIVTGETVYSKKWLIQLIQIWTLTWSYWSFFDWNWNLKWERLNEFDYSNWKTKTNGYYPEYELDENWEIKIIEEWYYENWNKIWIRTWYYDDWTIKSIKYYENWDLINEVNYEKN